MPKQSDNSRRIVVAIFICAGVFVISACVFTLVGQAQVSNHEKGAFEQWSQLVIPAGKPIHLRLEGEGEVLVETTEGRLFEWAPNQQPPWIEVQTPSGVAPYWGNCRPEEGSFFLVAEPPQQVREWVEATCPGPESSAHYEFVLLQNGEIWKWEFGTGLGFVFERAEVFAKGFVASLLLTAVVSAIAAIYAVARWRKAS